MRSRQLHDALENLNKAIHEVEAVVETIRTEHDPLASHISFHAATIGMPRGFLLSAKTLGSFNDIFFYVGIADNVGISYAFPSTKLARKSLGAGGTLIVYIVWYPFEGVS